MAKQLNRLNKEIEQKEKEEQIALLNTNSQWERIREAFRNKKLGQRDRRIILMVLIEFERKSYEELEQKYGFGINTIRNMKKAIVNGTTDETINGIMENKETEIH